MTRCRTAAWLVTSLVMAVAGPLAVGAAEVADKAPHDEAARRHLLQQADQALRDGHPAVALRHLERAALMVHSADTEMATVHAWLQAGQYSQASSFSAHTAGAHRQVAEGALLYARLLAVGGQRAAADQLLDAAIQRFPGDARLVRLRQDNGRFGPTDTPTSVRLAPYPTGSTPAPTARVAGSGVLIDAGRHALVPLALLDGARRIWLRDGLGQASTARIEQRDPTLGLALLRLQPPLRHTAVARAIGADGAELPLPLAASHDAFPGSPGYALFYPPGHHASPDWPQLQAGFNGLAAAANRPGGPGLGVPERADGGPLLNARGELAGVMVRTCPGPQAAVVPISRLRQRFGSLDWGSDLTASTSDPTARHGPLPTDQIYENGLRLALQVLVEAPVVPLPRCESVATTRSASR